MTLKFVYTKLGKNRYLRELQIEGEPYLIVINVLNLEVVKNPKKDFNKWKNKISSVRVRDIRFL